MYFTNISCFNNSVEAIMKRPLGQRQRNRKERLYDSIVNIDILSCEYGCPVKIISSLVFQNRPNCFLLPIL